MNSERKVSSKDLEKNKNEDSRSGVVFLQNPLNSETAVSRPRWKTPSPQSMSRISKEVSKVLDNLDSSFMSEDIPLNEEKLPIPINFDFDEMIFEKENLPIIKPEENSNQSMIVSDATSKDDGIENISKLTTNKMCDVSNAVQHSFQESDVIGNIDISYEVLIKQVSDKNDYVTQLFPLEDKGFSARPISDYKRIIEKTKTIHCSKENPKTHEIHNINSLESERQYESSSKTFHKVSDIDSKISKHQNEIAVSSNKITESNSFASSGRKFKVRNSFSRIPSAKLPRPVTRSNSCEIQNKTKSVLKLKTCIPYGQEANYIDPSNISKGYQVVNCLKDAGLKPTATSPFPSFPKHSFYTQSTPRLSFSKSLQNVGSSFHSSKSVKQNPVSFKLDTMHKQPLSAKVQKNDIPCNSMLSKPNEMIAMSTSSRKRFCSKLSLPSPLPVSFDKQLARQLFPNTSKD